jgi:hypothetical protein
MLGQQSPLMPAAVYEPPVGEPLVGDAAMRRMISEPDRVSREFKRVLGDPTPIVLGGEPHPVTRLLTTLVGAVVGAARDQEGAEPELVVLTRPANWGSFRRGLFDEVAAALETSEPLTITEPRAVAAHYAPTGRLQQDEIVAVYDLGGGSFDASVLARRGGRVELLGRPEGVERLGGADVDEAIFRFVDEIRGGLLDEFDLDDPEVSASLARLRLDCGIAKETLSTRDTTTIPVRLPDRRLEVPLTRDRLEALVMPFIETTIGALERSLHSAGITPEQLSSALLLGGMARMPLVASMISDELGARPNRRRSRNRRWRWAPPRSVDGSRALAASRRRESLGARRPAISGPRWARHPRPRPLPTRRRTPRPRPTAPMRRRPARHRGVRSETPQEPTPSAGPREASEESSAAEIASARGAGPGKVRPARPARETKGESARATVVAAHDVATVTDSRPNATATQRRSGTEVTTHGVGRRPAARPAGAGTPRAERPRRAPGTLATPRGPPGPARREPRPAAAPVPAAPARSRSWTGRELVRAVVALLVLVIGLAVAMGKLMVGSSSVSRPAEPPAVSRPAPTLVPSPVIPRAAPSTPEPLTPGARPVALTTSTVPTAAAP